MTRIRILISLIVLAACGESTSPPIVPSPPSFRLAAKTLSDTIGASLTSAIQVSVTEGRGQPLASAAVTLRVLPDRIYVEPGVVLRGGSSDTLATLRTSVAGTTNTDVTLGIHPGTFSVTVSVDGVARQDTMTFTVLPGAPAALRIPTRDTLMTVNTSYRPKIQIVDRLGNLRTDVAQLSTTSTVCQTSGDAVTASDVAQCRILARVGALRDSINITAVPAARIAVTIFHLSAVWLATMNLDGSNVNFVRPWNSSTFDQAHFVVSSTGMMASMAVGPDIKTHIQIIDPSGAARFIPVDLPAGAEETWPLFAPDGQSIFFSACNWPIYEHCRVWQTKLDGSQPKILTPSGSSTGQRSNWADISPDGTTLVYAARGDRLHTLNLQTGSDVDLGFNSENFSLDETGTRLASTRYGSVVDPIVISNRDGSNPRTIPVPAGIGFIDFVQWVPGGQWLISREMIQTSPDGAGSGPRVLVNTITGQLIPLKYTSSVGEMYVIRQRM